MCIKYMAGIDTVNTCTNFRLGLCQRIVFNIFIFSAGLTCNARADFVPGLSKHDLWTDPLYIANRRV